MDPLAGDANWVACGDSMASQIQFYKCVRKSYPYWNKFFKYKMFFGYTFCINVDLDQFSSHRNVLWGVCLNYPGSIREWRKWRQVEAIEEDADLQTVLCFYTVTRVKKSEGRNDEKISST